MENIICQFCYQFLDEPVLLQCKHPICSKCAQTQFSFELLRKPCDHFPLKTKHNQKEPQQKTHNAKKTVNICCPQCNEKTSLIITQGTTKLTLDLELAEKVKKEQEPKVYMCGEDDGMKATCPKHGYPLDMFCQRDQVTCCYQCFGTGEHEDHESTFVSHIAETIKKEAGGQLIEIDEQINKIKQALSTMTNLKEQVNLSHKQFREQVVENFDHVIAQLAKKKDTLVEESKKMEETTLSNIMLQQQALGDLLKQKTDMVEQTNKWLSGNDWQMAQCKQLLQRNQKIIASMLICCESGKMSTTLDMSPVEQMIDKLGSIVTIPVDLKLPMISGLKKHKKDEKSVTVQWDPVKCDFPEMYFIVQTIADNDDSTVKSFKALSNVTSLQVPVAENWKQLVCTIQCALGEQFQGEKCAPLTINLIDNDPQAILLHLKEKCSQKIYECVQKVFSQKGTQLDLHGCNIGDASAIALAKILPYLTQLQKLYLYYNQIGETGATAIANSITNLTQLQELWLDYNQIRDTGAITLAKSIEILTQLQEVNLDNNQIGDTGATAIASSISKLTRLNCLNLYHNNVSIPVQQQLKRQASNKLEI